MNGLAEISIAGRKVGLKFGMPAVRRFFEKAKEHQLMQDGNYTDLGLAHLFYAGYLNWCIMKDTVPALQFEDFYLWIEDPTETCAAEASAAVKAFEESKLLKPLIEAGKEAEKKKATMSSIGITSNPSVTESSASDH